MRPLCTGNSLRCLMLLLLACFTFHQQMLDPLNPLFKLGFGDVFGHVVADAIALLRTRLCTSV